MAHNMAPPCLGIFDLLNGLEKRWLEEGWGGGKGDHAFCQKWYNETSPPSVKQLC